MKRSKIKLLSSIFGLTLTSVAIVTTVVACSDQSTSQSQSNASSNDSEEANNTSPSENKDNPEQLTDNKDNSNANSNEVEPNLLPSKDDNKEVQKNNQSSNSSKINWNQIFESKEVTPAKKTLKVSDAVSQIDDLDSLYEFYNQPTNIPANYEVSFVSVVENNNEIQNSIKVTLSTKETNTNNTTDITFIIYGFATYSNDDYVQMFVSENMNAQAISSVNNQETVMLDPRDLSNQQDNPFFFKNYYDVKIPETFKENNLTVDLISYKVNHDDTVTYNYELKQQKNETNEVIGTPAIIVSGFYNYPQFVPSQIVDQDWKPSNDVFIRHYVNDLSDKKQFNQFIVDHWNTSLATDALNAIRWVYSDLEGQKTLTENMKQYIKDGWNNGSVRHWTIGYLMGYKYSTWNLFSGYKLDPKNLPFDPAYNSDVILEENNNLKLNLNWYQKQYKQSTKGGDYTADVDGSVSFEINALGKPTIDNDGNAFISTRLSGIINNEARTQRPTAHDGANIDFKILDALYYYYNPSSSKGQAIKNEMFSISSDYSKNLYSLFKSIFAIKDGDPKFKLRK